MVFEIHLCRYLEEVVQNRNVLEMLGVMSVAVAVSQLLLHSGSSHLVSSDTDFHCLAVIPEFGKSLSA